MNTRADASAMKDWRQFFSRLQLKRRTLVITEVAFRDEAYGGRGAWGLVESPSEVTYEGPIRLIIPGTKEHPESLHL